MHREGLQLTVLQLGLEEPRSQTQGIGGTAKNWFPHLRLMPYPKDPQPVPAGTRHPASQRLRLLLPARLVKCKFPVNHKTFPFVFMNKILRILFMNSSCHSLPPWLIDLAFLWFLLYLRIKATICSSESLYIHTRTHIYMWLWIHIEIHTFTYICNRCMYHMEQIQINM